MTPQAKQTARPVKWRAVGRAPLDRVDAIPRSRSEQQDDAASRRRAE